MGPERTRGQDTRMLDVCLQQANLKWRGSGLKPEGDADEQAEQSLILDAYLREGFQMFQHQNPHFPHLTHTKPTQGNDGSDNWV